MRVGRVLNALEVACPVRIIACVVVTTAATVDQLTDDVGVSGMLGGLGHDAHEQ